MEIETDLDFSAASWNVNSSVFSLFDSLQSFTFNFSVFLASSATCAAVVAAQKTNVSSVLNWGVGWQDLL